MRSELINILRRMGGRHILVVGDYMLDHYVYGSCQRISPEAPVPVLKFESEWSVAGGAGNAAANIAATGQQVYAMTTVGADPEADLLCNLLERCGVAVDGVIREPNRPTTKKTRFLAQGKQQLLRLDSEDTTSVSEESRKCMLDWLKGHINELDLIVISDYEKGVLDADFISGIMDIAKTREVRVVTDVKGNNAEKYKGGVWLIKPNLKELSDLTGMPVADEDEIVRAAKELRMICECQYVLVTKSERGMTLVGDDVLEIPCEARSVFDVTGAGDTTLAYLASALACGASVEAASILSNIAAGIKVSKAGTAVVTKEEVLAALRSDTQRTDHKIVSAQQLSEELKRTHGKVVFTNGCFDILHAGHAAYLKAAAALGDVLVVGVNSDSSVRRLKGTERPIIGELERMEMLAALECVDYVVKFDEDTPLKLIKTVHPDVLVKGGDYLPEQVVGRAEVESWGGELKLIPFVAGKSTSGIIQKIRGLNNESGGDH